MKAFKSILSVMLVLCLVFPLMPMQTEASASGTTAVRGVKDSIFIDDDPTDGYEGDYVVIYNPSLIASNSVSTGSLTGLIETSVEPNVLHFGKNCTSETDMPLWKIDIDSELSELAKTVEPGAKPEPKRESYNIGSTKTFEIVEQYSPTGSDSMVFECLYVGEHCYIWTPVSSANNTYPLDEIDSTYAKIAADEFDSKFDLMQSSFGNHETGSGDGKLHMLYYNIDEGWNGYGGYVAGFFYAYDLYYNDLPILNIDTYPGVYYKNPSSGNVYKRIDDTFSTMVHEYQHLINFSNTSGMESWLNECFSAAAEEICYPGSSVVSRIQSWENYYYSANDDWLTPPAEFEYKTDFALHNGYSMYNWSNSIGDVLALYAQVSFFAQYLYTRFGNTIYRQISEIYTSSEVNAITNATGVSCSELVHDFRVAVTANASQDQYGGIYGFKTQNGYDPSKYHNVQNPWNLLSPIIFTGQTCAINGGGAITVKPVGGAFNPPSDADPNLQYIGIKLASPYTVTAISNNEDWGTVSVHETKITAVPAAGYYVADYEVVNGTATAVISGNIVRVTPESDCTIKVIFALKPSYTVRFLANGVVQGNQNAQIYDDIILPTSVNVQSDGWAFIGWTETEIPEETESKPVYYAPGASFTVTGNTTLYAVYSRVEEGAGAPVYELVSSAPSDWSGNYVISYRTVNSSGSPMYLMKGISVGSNGTSIEGNSNAAQYAVTGATLNGTTLTDVADDYLFELEPHGSYYSIRSVKTGSFLGINSSGYLSGYNSYTSGNCDWNPGTKTNASSATVAISSNYPIVSFYVDGPFFWAGSIDNNSAALFVRFWKETAGDVTYYSTNPGGATTVQPVFVQQSILMTGQIALRFYMDLSVLTEEQMADSYVTFVFADSSGNLQRALTSRDDFDASHKAGDLYYFTCKTSPVQMANVIVATYHYGDGRTVEKTYSIEQYFETYDNNQNLFSEKQQAVVKAMADYGYYTQKFLVSEGTITLGNKYAEITKHYAESYDIDEIRSAVAEKEIVKTNKTNGDITDITFSLSLADQPIINVYFKPMEGYEGGIVVKQGSNELEVKTIGGQYRVQIKDIPAHLLGKTYTLKATTENGTATVKVSALSYVHALLTNTAYANNEDAEKAAAAIYCYYKAAYELKYGN